VTEVVYLCSPDRWRQLLTSLNGLYNSRTTFDRLRILLVGQPTAEWTFDDSRVVVEPVAPVAPEFFMATKVLLCRSDAERVLFIDTDTFVFEALDSVWSRRDADVVGRPGPNYLGERWNRQVWERTFEQFGARVVPMFNAGFLIFQNGSHRQIQQRWQDLVSRYVSGELPSPYPRRVYEQLALAVAIGVDGLSYDCLAPREHAYGPLDEPLETAVLYHTGARQYDRYYRRIMADPSLARKLRPAFRSRMHRKARREDATRWARDKYRALLGLSRAWSRSA
jgi:hypothetical protein